MFSFTGYLVPFTQQYVSYPEFYGKGIALLRGAVVYMISVYSRPDCYILYTDKDCIGRL